MTRIRCRAAVLALALAAALALSGCSQWRGLNSLQLPGTQGKGPGAFTIQAQMQQVVNLRANSRVRVGDVTVGNITKIERQGWHALVTMKLNGDVNLPANSTATLGQTSLLGSLHIELAPPTDEPPQGKLQEGSLIPLDHTGAYPSTEETLSALSLVLNGGGVARLGEIIRELGQAFDGRGEELRSLINQLDTFVAYIDNQKDDIIAAADSLNTLVGQIADDKPVVDRALKSVPEALQVLREEREVLVEAADKIGKFSALAADSVNQTKENLIKELKDLGPVLESLANAGQDLTRSLDFYATFPFPKPTLPKWLRGDYANLTAVIDLTLSRLDASFFTGTFLEGELTELELQWGRTIGQMPSPYTARNPLVVPYHFNQGP
ncbi:virulence factor Mce family protein [Mycolicibacterium phlei]|uniref:virulence factor Mce family protein n=1 Tax=Mycolicibacterium phlei TaxID=1771 RepID=UPI0037CA867F